MKYPIAVLALAFTVPVLAQAGSTGSIRSDDAAATLPKEGHFTGDAARAISDKFATCVVKRHYQPVIKALQMDRDTADQYKALHRLLDAECWGGNGLESQSSGYDIEMTTNPFSFRGALLKAVVGRDFSRHGAPFSTEPLVSAGLSDGRLKLADCVVRRDPATALQVLVAKSGTSAEASALAALNPQMSQCLGEGITLSFSKATLVAYLAEAYFLEAEAAKSAGGQ
jgi:hypothetical protein